MKTTFTQRTQQFWEWFTANEQKLSELTQKRDSDTGEIDVAFISQGVSLLSEHLHFNVGGNHEFTFAVSGNGALFYLLPYVTANLPEQFRDKWTFFPCMQGTGGQSFGFKMHDIMVNNDDVMVSAVQNEDGKSAVGRDTLYDILQII